MKQPECEKAFDRFVETREFEALETLFFRCLRTAFEAGWQAAQEEKAVDDQEA